MADSLPEFDDGKVYALTGKTLNQLKDAIIREILTVQEQMTVEKKGKGKIKLSLVNPVPDAPETGNHVLTAQEGDYVWEEIEDC